MRSVAFLILPEFSHLGLAAALEPLFVANWLAQRALFDWKIVSVDGAAVTASNGRVSAVDGDLEAAAACKTVFVLASFDAQRAVAERRAVRWLKRISRFGTEIGGLENGSLVLAEAGLLNGHQAAVHWDNALGFQQRYPKAAPVAQLYVRSRDRVTCAGAAAILDLMIAWIGWHADVELAAEVAEHLLLNPARAADSVQRPATPASRTPRDAVVLQAQALMSRHVEDPLSCGQIAQRVGLSLRQIERRFQQVLGSSLLRQYRQIRMEKAHQLLQQTDLGVTRIALSCGFGSPEYFCRLYRSQFGCSPSRDRTQSTTAPVLRRQGLKHV